MTTEIGRGTDKRFPSLEERFDITAAPGFGDNPRYFYNDLFALLDHRDQPGNPRGGGYYGVTWRRYADLNRDRYQFSVAETDLQQFFPIFDKKRVIAVRGRLTTATADAGNLVPIYFLPTLGGGDSLRSARDYRFRDKTALAMNLEYRWEAFSGLDMALFTDWGNVAPSVADLDFTRLKRAHGVGLRFNTFKSVFMRLDVALAGTEAPRYFLKFSKVF
jgi:outer membrane translocation and assembly module TamA